MKIPLKIIFLFLTINLYGQNKSPEYFGFRHLQTIYKGDTVDILIKSKSGEENKDKWLYKLQYGKYFG